ncbi:hypothetical protein [Pseudomonas sp. RIT-To-2]|uniref:hypothetical protein n=1 Tax=Pseudomonas sp. RIT-To-2 TaxID=3462541 RepID=UPI00241398B0
MSKYRVRTADDLLTVEAASYVQDSTGLKLYNAAGEFLAQFTALLSVVRVDALVSETSTTPATETGADSSDAKTQETAAEQASVETPELTAS